MLLSPERARNLSVVGQRRGIEWCEVDGARLTVGDKLGHRLAGRRSVQHTPDAVSGRDIGVVHIRNLADQGDTETGPRQQAIVGIGRSSMRGWHDAIA